MIAELITAQRHFKANTGKDATKIGLTKTALIALRYEIYELHGGVYKPDLSGTRETILGLEVLIEPVSPIIGMLHSFYLQ